MELVKDSETESMYLARIQLTNESRPVEYKYILKDEDAIVCWETIPGNRIFNEFSGLNVAKNKASSQSSIHTTSDGPHPGDRMSSLGNNGSRNGFFEWNCCRTTRETSPWWQVDLEKIYPISSLCLWKALTHHEMPREPASFGHRWKTWNTRQPRIWIFISTKPLVGSLESLKQSAIDSKIYGRRLEYDASIDDRVHVLKFCDAQKPEISDRSSLKVDIPGQFVRVQIESESSALQFAELEVYTRESIDEKEALFEQDDGIFAIECSPEGSLLPRMDHGWLDPQSNKVELRLRIGSLDYLSPAINWNIENQGDVRLSLTLLQRRSGITSMTSAHEKVAWEESLLRAQGNYSVHAESPGLLGNYKSFLSKKDAPLYAFLNHLDLSVYNQPLTPGNGTSGCVESLSQWMSRCSWKDLIRPEQLQRLCAAIKVSNYEPNDVILPYGERIPTMWFVRTGVVDLYGPETTDGSNLLRSLNPMECFNELALFGTSDRKCASFKARGFVSCEHLSQRTIIDILGLEGFSKCRSFLVRELSSQKKHLHLEQDSSDLVLKDHLGYIFKVQLPASSFSSSETDSSFRLRLDFHDEKRYVGSSYIFPSQFTSKTEGTLRLSIIGMDDTDNLVESAHHTQFAGEISVDYIIIKPFVHADNNIKNVWRRYWRERPPLNIGHRGMGRSFAQVDGFRHALFRENSLASFILAGRSGADFVEVDVQLTKDQIPILYHDFTLKVGLEDQHAWSKGTRSEECELGIHELTLRQLTRCATQPMNHGERPRNTGMLRKRIQKHWKTIIGGKYLKSNGHENGTLINPDASNSKGPEGNHPAPRPSSDGILHDLSAYESLEHLVDFFPLLEDLLHYVPAHVGLNIEIKYPDSFYRKQLRELQFFELNRYIDAILTSVFHHAGPRRIFFSSFDPHVCMMLHSKQIKYAVFLLSCGSLECIKSRNVCQTLQFALEFAQLEQLQGVVTDSKTFLQNPEMMDYVKEAAPKLLWMTYGDQNTSFDAFQCQKKHALDAIISDNIGDLIRKERKLLNHRK
uniref:Glycerophosphodiesterase putative n=1 Tax=Albugo laibachii Nc14 TaxID=890382 RepID=F0WG60_9STRA|nr:glycerophosphodiesterase putative [Albugo laibachii Nc14]|eukprot:CCA20195.1 glycerophosphodiesterase putative [Albugo laibachii Nc14]